MKFKKYIEEETLSTDIAGYDTPASKKTFKRDMEDENIVSVTIKNPDDFEKIQKIAKQNNVGVMRPRKTIEQGDDIQLMGSKENVNKVMSQLKEQGIV